MVSGIYDFITFECIANTSIVSVTHVQKYNKKGVTLIVTAKVHAYKARRHCMCFSLNEVQCDVEKDLVKVENIISHTFFISNPQLWFPAGYGAQPRYNVSFSTDDAAKISQKIGLREIEIKNKKDTHGTSFVVVVNGIAIFCKVANWIPCDCYVIASERIGLSTSYR